MRQQINEFLQFMEAEKESSANTTAAYQNDLSQFLSFLEGYSTPMGGKIGGWQDVDEQVVQEYLLDLKGRGYASSTVARKVASVKSFLHYLAERGVMGQDPSKRLASPKVKKNLPRSIQPQEFERLLASPGNERLPKTLRDKALL